MTGKAAPVRRRRRQKSKIETNIQFARLLFDPDASARMASMIVAGLKNYSERHGITFRSTMRYVDVYQTSNGAAKLAETNDMGPLGSFLRYLNREGWLSPSEEVLEALRARSNLKHNKQIEAWIKQHRNTKPVLDVMEADRRRLRERRKLHEIVATGDAFLDSAIRPMVDHRDIPVGVPKYWNLGVPMAASPEPKRGVKTTSDTPLDTTGRKQTAAERS